MKVRLLISAVFLLLTGTAFSQWQTNSGGTTYYLSNTAYKVGIGHNSSTAANEKLHVLGNILSSGNIQSNGNLVSLGTITSSGNITGAGILGTAFIGNTVQSSSGSNLVLNTWTTTRITILNSNGNVGIGEASPAEKLHINGSIRGNQSGALRISSGTGTVDIGSKSASFGNIDTDRTSFLFNKKIFVDGGMIGSYDEPLQLQAAGTTAITVLTNGNVGIGTTLGTNPYKLAVNGKIGTKEVQVETSGAAWPDYVFNTDYKLMPLTLLEAYIQANNHLPDVPSAKEIETDGHRLGEMDAILLKKVEELTLYLLELKKQNEALQKRVNDLEVKASK